MKKYWYEIIKITLIVVSSFIGASALWGGINLLVDPSGQGLGVEQYLSYIEFANDYLFIGIMLIAIIALSQFLSVVMLLLNNNYAGIYIAVAGALLLIWASIELVLIGWIIYSTLYFVLAFIQIGLAVWFYYLAMKKYKK